MKPLEFRTQILTTLLKGAILEISLQVVSEVHDLTLEQLHFVSHFIEFNHVLCNQLLLQVEVSDSSWWAHPNPVILLLYHVVDALDTHKEAENCVVVDQ